MLIEIRNKFIKRLNIFRKDDKGVAALEFAYIAPVLIVLWLGTIELSLALTIDRKVSRIASTVADLMTQEDEITEDGVADILKISEDIMFPYEADPNIIVSGIEIAEGDAKVVWSRSNGDTSLSVGDLVSVPDQIKIDDTFLVIAEVEVSHTPIVGIFSLSNSGKLSKDTSSIELSDRLFLRPRKSAVKICPNSGCT